MGVFDRFRRKEEEPRDYGTTTGAGPMWSSAPAEPYFAQNDGGRQIAGAAAGTVGVGAFERPSAAGLMLGESMAVQVIGRDQIREAMETLRKYKAGKANFDKRTVENEEWWKLRHWKLIKERGTTTLDAKSAWLVNVIMSKHADFMDAMPEPNCLPRAADDEQEAATLSKIIPVILRRSNFDRIWNQNTLKKLKTGVAFYGVFWDSDAENGLGDVAVRRIDPLSLFWEPGIMELQDSANVFLVNLVDNNRLEADYPELEGTLKGKTFNKSEYLYDDTVDTSDKSPVIDWYYKKRVNGRDVLHYVKFVGDTVLFATENEAGMTDRGLYDHGLYPFFADPLLTEEGTPTGYGYIDICKDPQRQIDLMNNAIVANAIACATPRWLKRGDDGINEEEYADWTRPFVHVQGSIDENAMKQITVSPMPGNLLNILDMKINEMKETSGNRDVNNGGSPAGVTAASAIAAMQEQSGKLSRDQIQGSYNCYSDMIYCIIDLIRQFYDLPRKFRILGEDGMAQYVSFDNSGLQVRPIPGGYWKPVFDIEVTAQKQSAYSKLSYNELAIQFFQLGFFNPQMAEPALAALDMMDFKGKEKVRKHIQDNAMLFQAVQMLQAENAMLKAKLGLPVPGAEGGAPEEEGKAPAGGKPVKPANTDPMGNPMDNNRIAEKAKAQAAAATQPR